VHRQNLRRSIHLFEGLNAGGTHDDVVRSGVGRTARWQRIAAQYRASDALLRIRVHRLRISVHGPRMGPGVSTAGGMPWSADGRRKDTSVNASKGDGRDRKNNFQVDLQTCSASWRRRNRSPRRLYRSIIQRPCALLRHSSAPFPQKAEAELANDPIFAP
jgi:hypothetical protein